MEGVYNFKVFAALIILAAVTEAEEFCDEARRIVLDSKEVITIDPVKFMKGDFINYEHMAIRIDSNREYDGKSGEDKTICPFIYFSSGKEYDIKGTLEVKDAKGQVALTSTNTLTQEETNKAIFNLVGSVQQKEKDGKFSSKHPYKGHFIFFHADDSILGYIFCTERKGLHRVSFAIALKQEKRAEVEKNTNYAAFKEIQKKLKDVGGKMVKIIKFYSDKSAKQNADQTSKDKSENPTDEETSIQLIENKIRKFPENCPN